MVAKRASAPGAPAAAAATDMVATETAPPMRPAPSAPQPSAMTIEAPRLHDPQVAAYIAHLAGELGSMARAGGFDLLAYFLDMARIEANIQTGKD